MAVSASVSSGSGAFVAADRTCTHPCWLFALQVLCSALAWSASCSSTLPRLQATPVVGSSLGAHTLKGIADKVTIMHCTLDPEQAAAAAAVATPAVLA